MLYSTIRHSAVSYVAYLNPSCASALRFRLPLPVSALPLFFLASRLSRCRCPTNTSIAGKTVEGDLIINRNNE